jgi:hypothetical protein
MSDRLTLGIPLLMLRIESFKMGEATADVGDDEAIGGGSGEVKDFRLLGL